MEGEAQAYGENHCEVRSPNDPPMARRLHPSKPTDHSKTGGTSRGISSIPVDKFSYAGPPVPPRWHASFQRGPTASPSGPAGFGHCPVG